MLDQSHIYIQKILSFLCFNIEIKMANICPLLIRASFTGRTYHDFQLKFESPLTNCTVESVQNPLLIQFTRILNSTLNHTSYAIYDPTEPNGKLPHLQVFNDDHVNLCVRSAIDTNNNHITCHEFYMITMLSSINTTFWPLLIIFGYISVLLVAMLFSFCIQAFHKVYTSRFSMLITEKLLKYQHICLFLPLLQRYKQHRQIKKLDDKKNISKAIDLIAKECQQNLSTFSIQTTNVNGHINLGYL